VVGFTRGLVKDLHGTGVDAKVVCPQLVDTGFYQVSVGARQMEGLLDKVKSRMDTTDQVVEGIMKGIFSEQLVILPTEKSEKAYERFRDI
jgi:short-subunit dehydrogenase